MGSRPALLGTSWREPGIRWRRNRTNPTSSWRRPGDSLAPQPNEPDEHAAQAGRFAGAATERARPARGAGRIRWRRNRTNPTSTRRRPDLLAPQPNEPDQHAAQAGRFAGAATERTRRARGAGRAVRWRRNRTNPTSSWRRPGDSLAPQPNEPDEHAAQAGRFAGAATERTPTSRRRRLDSLAPQPNEPDQQVAQAGFAGAATERTRRAAGRSPDRWPRNRTSPRDQPRSIS